ncbi:MAG: formate dehydrogenase subunit gamma [Betaproteobacteria bacterium]|nr:formate dehydrogenase subunit gamma [Betaproteobacteria bacterium]
MSQRKRFVRLLVAALAICLPQLAVAASEGQKQQAERQLTQPLNNAPVWRDVRAGEGNPYQTTQVRGIETNVLIQSEGEIWREIRNGPVTVYGGLFVLIIASIIGLFHWLRGPIKLRERPTGRWVKRFTDWERLVHWSTAISFLVLAVSGLVILFGKYIVLPVFGGSVFGYAVFSWLAAISKNLHNFVGPLFIVCASAMFVTYVKDNLWRSYDFRWLGNSGGMLWGEHVPSGKFNAGEKVWFWFGLFLLSIVLAVTGLILDFPNFGQGRATMQLVNVVHAIAAVIYMGVAMGHIYMGTVGVEGTYDSMRISGGDGSVDETWAKEHHEYWYKEVIASRGREAAPTGAAAQPQH